MASIATNLLLATIVCMAVLMHTSQQMPVRSARSTCTSPVHDRDLLLGLGTLLKVFNAERTSIDQTNLAIQIKDTSDYKTVADNLCSLMMYSDFLTAASNASSRLQAMQLVLNENVKDGCSLLKLEAARSNSEVNFTTGEDSQGGSEAEPSESHCTTEELTALRTYCVEQSFLQQFIQKPFEDIHNKVHSDCLSKQCDWIGRHFQEPERSVIVDSASNINCSDQ